MTQGSLPVPVRAAYPYMNVLGLLYFTYAEIYAPEPTSCDFSPQNANNLAPQPEQNSSQDHPGLVPYAD